MELHKLLKRQMDRRHLSYDQLPADLDLWHDFINNINSSYIEFDQERYLLDRAMDISSKEMLDVNTQLEYAQEMGNIGYWQYDAQKDLISWSKSLFKLLNINPLNKEPSSLEFLAMIHPADRQKIKAALIKALRDKIGYDDEIRIKTGDMGYKWFRTVARTRLANHFISGVMLDIDKEKTAAENIRELNSKLMSTARMAGMSEVATSVLHNVGNVLNSTTVSACVIKETLHQPSQKKLLITLRMIKDNINHINEYLASDEKGKYIIPYLLSILEHLEHDLQTNTEEIDNIEKNLAHIREIVSMQQSISKVSNILEDLDIAEIINKSIDITIGHNSEINLVSTLDSSIKTIRSDKAIIMQILINLIQNAKDSLLESNVAQKEITVSVTKSGYKNISISIKDNGLGIAKELKDKIFSFGFTSKKEGHGFGLHSAALSVKNINGTLAAHSQGVGKGAEFILTLPISINQKSGA